MDNFTHGSKSSSTSPLRDSYQPMPQILPDTDAEDSSPPESKAYDPQVKVDDPQSQSCSVFLCISLLCSIVFAGLVVFFLGLGIVQLWVATMWSMALLILAVEALQPSIIDSIGDNLGNCILNRPCKAPEYEDGNLAYEFAQIIKRYKFLAVNVVMLGALGLGGDIALNASMWTKNLKSATHLRLIDEDPSPSNGTMSYVLLHPEYTCKNLGEVPMPYSYLLLKLTFVGFLQDLVFGSEDLKDTRDRPVAASSLVFVAYQIATFVLRYVQVVQDLSIGRIAGTPWRVYQVVAFKIVAGSPFVNVILLMCKMLVETNIDETRGGSPHAFDVMERYRFPKLESGCKKASIFWVVVSIVAITGVPVFFTHAIPALVGSACALSFPLWGVLCLAFSPFSSTLHAVGLLGAEAFAQVCGTFTLLMLMVVSSMLMREQLWRIQCQFSKSKGGEEKVNGTSGYTKGTMTLFFATPILFCTQSFLIWADLAYGGWYLGNIPMTEYNMRVFKTHTTPASLLVAGWRRLSNGLV